MQTNQFLNLHAEGEAAQAAHDNEQNENDLGPVSILRLFETTKSERGEFVSQLIERLDNGEANPLDIHLQIKSAEDLIKQITESKAYKDHTLTAAEKYGKKFDYHNAGFQIKEAGTKFDFSKCNDPILWDLEAKFKEAAEALKERQDFLKTVPEAGLEIRHEDELITVYRPSKTSTTALSVSLK